MEKYVEGLEPKLREEAEENFKNLKKKKGKGWNWNFIKNNQKSKEQLIASQEQKKYVLKKVEEFSKQQDSDSKTFQNGELMTKMENKIEQVTYESKKERISQLETRRNVHK